MSGGPTLILHAGGPKTGSSALQAMLARNVEALRNHGVDYPTDFSVSAARRGRTTSGNGVLVAKLLGAVIEHPGDVEVVTSKVRSLGVADRLLYSCEMMSQIDVDAARGFRENILPKDAELRVVVYVRSIADHALSAYNQYIKSARTRNTFAGFVVDEYDPAAQEKTLRKLFAAFGPRSCLVRSYDSVRTQLFCDFLVNALLIDDLSDFDLRPLKVNRSLTAVEIALMRAMQPVFTHRAQARAASDGMVYATPDSEPFRNISPSTLDTLAERSAESIEFLNRHISGPPVSLISEHLHVSDVPEVELTEVEIGLATAIAGAIQAGNIRISHQ